MTGPAFQRLVLCAKADMADGSSSRQVREAAAIPGLDQKPVKLSKLQGHTAYDRICSFRGANRDQCL